MDNIIPLRHCKKCGNDYPLTTEYFQSRNDRNPPFHYHCKQCDNAKQRRTHQELSPEVQVDRAAYHKRYYQEHREQAIEVSRQYRVDHKEQITAYKSRSYQANKEQESLRHKLWYASHKEHASQSYKRYYQVHRKQRLEDRKHHYQTHREQASERNRQYREVHKETLNEYRRQWYQFHKDYVIEQSKQYREVHRDEIRAYEQQHRTMESVKAHRKVSHHKRRARKYGNGGTYTTQQIQEQYNRQKGTCYYCHKKTIKYHIEHVVPISRGGTNDISNIVLSCPTCNFKKGAKLPHEFFEGGRLM